MRKLKLFLSLLMLFTFSVGNLWADDPTKTEGFETKAASTTYNSTVTISEAESDCGIGWTIYYGTVSTNDKISGTKSAQMRYYSSSNNRGYVQSTTPVDGLSHVDFKARVSSTDIKMTVSYSADGSVWTALATNVTFSKTGQGLPFGYDIPSGGKFIKIEIGDGSKKPSSGSIKFIVDDVVFTYTAAPSNPTVSFEQPTTGTLALSVAGSPIESGAEVAENTEVTVTATPGEGYKLPASISFKNGDGDDVNPEDLTFDGTAFLMPAYDLTVAASFTAKASYTVTVDKAVYDKNGDLVEPTPEGFTAIVKGGSTSTTVLEDGEVTIVAEPKAGYEFAGWFLDNDDYADIENDEAAETKLINFTHDVTVYADFEELTTPSLAVDPASLDFGSVGVGSTPVPLQFTLTGANLIDNAVPVTLDAALNGVFTLSHQQVKVGDGAVNQVITVTPNTANVGEYSGNITITATNAESKTVALSLTVQQTYTATWYVNGTATKTQTAAAGTALEVPADPSATGDCEGLVFRGWITSPLAEAQDEAPEFVTTEGLKMPSANVDFYAVFATANIEGQEGDPEWVATAYADLATDDVVVVTITKPGTNAGTYALPNDNGAKSAPTATTITITDNQIDAPADNLQWDVVKVGDNITFNVHGSTTSWLFCKDTNNGVRVGNTTDDSDATNKVFMLSDGDLSKNYYLKSTTLTRYIGVYNAQDWRCYGSINSNLNSGDQELTFFKKTVSKTQTTTYSGYLTTCPSCEELTLNAVVDGGHGSIALQVGGKDVTSVKTCDPVVVDVVATPDDGYALSSVELSDGSNASYADGQITIPANETGTLTVTATFAAVEYTVTLEQTGGANAELSATPEVKHFGDEITISAENKEAAGYVFLGWTAPAGVTLANAKDLSTTFTMPANDVTLTAKYTKILTVAEAIAAIDEAGTTINDQVIEAYISQIDSYNSKYSSITYWIKNIDANGFLTGTNFEVYGGLGLDGDGFTGEDDIVVGAKVRIFGQIKYYTDGDVYEFNSNNYLLSYDAPKNPSVVVYGTATKTAYEVGDSFDFDGLSAKTAYDNKYATAIAEPEWAADPATIAANTTSVSVTANGAGAKNIDVTVLTHELTFNATPENGTVSVVYNSAAVATGDHFVKGDVLTITATPASADYALTSLTVNGDAFISGNTYEVGTTDIVVVASFAAKADPAISWSNSGADVNVTLGDTYVLPTLNNPNGLMVELSSTNEEAAYLDEGQIKIAGAGETTISATFAGNETYKASTVSYKLTVAEPASYSLKNNWNGGEWDWAVMTYAGDGEYILEDVVFGGTGVNWRQGDSGDGTWVELASFEGDNIQAWDNVTLVLDPSAGTITATLNSRAVVEFGGSWTQDWSEGKITAVVSTDKTYAAVKKELTKGEWYNFKPIVGGHWLGCSAGATGINRTSNSVHGFVYQDGDNHIYFQADVTGEYEFKWVYTTNTVIVTFPDHTYTVAWSLNDGADEALGELEKMGDSDIFAKYFDKDILAVGSYVVKVFQDEETTPITTANLVISEVAKYYVEFDYNASENELQVNATNKGTATELDNTGDGQKAVKMMKDNTIYILRGNKTYTITGQLVK